MRQKLQQAFKTTYHYVAAVIMLFATYFLIYAYKFYAFIRDTMKLFLPHRRYEKGYLPR